MAFSKADLTCLANGNGKSLYVYLTSGDTLATVEGANYFDAAYRELGDNDMILVIASDAQDFYRVQSSTSSGVTILPFPSDVKATFGPSTVASLTVRNGRVTAASAV